MKRFCFIVGGLLMSGMFATVNAQSAYDAGLFIGGELNGTARYVGMGGAMGALGGDLSVMSSNPAAMGIYRSNDLAVSFGFNNSTTESTFNNNMMKDDKTRASFDQAGFVYSNKLGNYSTVRFFNLGFNYHKHKNFNRMFSMGGLLDGFSQSQMMAGYLADVDGMNSASEFDAVLGSDNPYKDYWGKYTALSMMGARTRLVDWPDDQIGLVGWEGYNNLFHSEEWGGINQYDFSMAVNIQDRFYLGATFGVYDALYNRVSSYTEELNDDNGAENGGYTLDNKYRLSGTGFDVKLGMLFRPFEFSPFRIGVAVHSPIWYDMREEYDATLSSDIAYWGETYTETLSDYLPGEYLTYDYRMRTPWKYNVSMGTTFSKAVAIGAEYEYQDFSSTKLRDIDDFELGGEASMKECLQGVHTLKLGIETRMDNFMIRAGYNYSSAAYKKEAYNPLPVYGTRSDYENNKERQTVTFGLGYHTGMFYADLAYKYDMYKSNFYAFEDIDLPATKVDNDRHQLLMTLGIRF